MTSATLLPPDAFGAVPEAARADAAALRAWLVPRVAAMLASDRARLLAILYRVDVRERDLNAALAAPDVPAALADALVARMVETQRTRRARTAP